MKTEIKNLIAVSNFASNDWARYYLNGVFFDADNNKMVATSGLILGVLSDSMQDTEDVESFIMHNDTIKTIVSGLTAKQKKVAKIEITSDNVSVVYQGLVIKNVPYAPIDGTFPDYKRVIPEASDYARGANFGFDTSLIVKIEKALKVLNKRTHINFNFNACNSPVLTEVDNFTCVIMPCKTEQSEAPSNNKSRFVATYVREGKTISYQTRSTDSEAVRREAVKFFDLDPLNDPDITVIRVAS